ncbi:methylated-DNA--[protein]-cysteine S-methyltransferase [Elizabethkingia meningoseptica]|uniref:methylated-DNA--[protein]-cysteine S-methyltransferase n=1 Tax=Elizabethkingia meningoseptica TaxID=238 RepID=UPI0023AE8A30|nr:hypothetical protein [Elizabethkingia meningoseptica]
MEDPKQLVYKDVASPVGLVRAIASNKGLVAIIWEGEDYKRTKLSVPVKDDKHPILIQTEKELNEYFNNKRTTFDIPLDFKGTEFQIRVWEAFLKGKTKCKGPEAETQQFVIIRRSLNVNYMYEKGPNMLIIGRYIEIKS